MNRGVLGPASRIRNHCRGAATTARLGGCRALLTTGGRAGALVGGTATTLLPQPSAGLRAPAPSARRGGAPALRSTLPVTGNIRGASLAGPPRAGEPVPPQAGRAPRSWTSRRPTERRTESQAVPRRQGLRRAALLRAAHAAAAADRTARVRNRAGWPPRGPARAASVNGAGDLGGAEGWEGGARPRPVPRSGRGLADGDVGHRPVSSSRRRCRPVRARRRAWSNRCCPAVWSGCRRRP